MFLVYKTYSGSKHIIEVLSDVENECTSLSIFKQSKQLLATARASHHWFISDDTFVGSPRQYILLLKKTEIIESTHPNKGIEYVK